MMRVSPGDDEIKDVGNRLACSFTSWQARTIFPLSYKNKIEPVLIAVIFGSAVFSACHFTGVFFTKGFGVLLCPVG